MIYSEGQNGELNLDFKAVVKNMGVGWLQIKNKISKKNCKVEFLAVLVFGVGVLGPLRFSRVLSSCWGG